MIFRNIAWACLMLPVFVGLASAQTPTLPSINTNYIVNVTNFGAVGDGSTVNTTAIQNAIKAAAAGGITNGLAGGTVEIPPGIYLSGQLNLSNKVNLQVDAGAELKFQSYPTITGSTSYLITANTINDIEISGSGTIDGNGASWWNIASAPYMIYFNHCARILVQNVTLQNPPKQHMVFKSTTSDVTIQGIIINTPGNSPNTDGMDLIGTRCLVQNCAISDGDDNIALGSTGGTTSGVLITNCIFGYGHGVSIGSNTQGGVSNLTVINCVWTNTNFGIRMKSDVAGSSPGAGGISQFLNYYNVSMTNVAMPILIFSYYNEYSPPGVNVTTSFASSQTLGSANIPVWRNIVISNLTATSCGESLIWGRIELPVTNVTLIDCKFLSAVSSGSSYNFGIYNAHGVQIVDSQISTAFGKKTFTLYNAGVIITNSATTNGTVTIDGLASSNSLALYRASASLNDSAIFGANPVTLNASTLTDGTSLALPASTVMNFDLGTNNTIVAVSGNLSLSNTVNVADGGGFGFGAYTLFSYTGSLAGSPVLGSKPASFSCVLITNIPGQINLISGAFTNLLVLLPATATKGDGVLTNAGHMEILTPLSTNLLVHLISSDTSKLTVPTTVTIPAGQTFIDFNVTILDDSLTDGAQLVAVTASAPNFASGSNSMTIRDKNLYQFAMSAVASPQSAGTPFMLSLTAQTVDGSTITSYQSAINLTAAGDHGADVVHPTTVAVWINGVWTGGVQVNTPDINVRLTARDGAGHSGSGNLFNVQTGSLDHFAFNTIPSPQHQDVPFPVTITAEDAGDNLITNFSGSVNLAAFTVTGSSNVVFSANFEDGLDGFTIDNTIGSTNGSGNGLWHLSTGQATNGNHSAYHSLYYGQGEILSGGGNYNTGYTNEGVVTSPMIDLTGQTGPLTLSFNYFLDSEYYYYGDDYASVEISQNGGPFTSLSGYLYPTAPYWQPFTMDLSGYAGSQIQLRFHFISYNQYTDYEGWYVDDVVINNGNTATPLNLNPTSSTAFVSGVWTGAVAVIDAFSNVFLNADDGAGHTGDSSGFAVQANADLAVSLFTSPSTIQAGNNLIYVVFVSNNGPERASLVTFNDPLPSNVTVDSVELSQGTYSINYNNNAITCSFGSLDSGDFAIAVITVTPQVKMILTNTVTASTGAIDTNQANNTATAVTTVQGEGILQVYGNDFLPGGPAGGLFYPSVQNYTLQNNGTAPFDWSVNNSATWMSFSPTNGTLLPFDSTNVVVSTTPAALILPAGVYNNPIVFANITDGNGTTAFNGVLTVLNPLPVAGSIVSGNNGDGLIDPNACSALYLVISNSSAVPITGINATLCTTTPGVAVAQGSSPYPDLQPGDSASNSIPFYISTTAGFPCGGTVNLLLNLTSSSGGSTAAFNLVDNYTMIQSAGAVLVPGTNDIIDDCYGCLAAIDLPFNYTFYGQTYSNATVSTFGNLQFVGDNSSYAYYNCLPADGYTDTIFAYWGYLYNQEVSTGVSGVSPNRIFNIEWSGDDLYGYAVDYEIRLYEGQQRFDLIYGAMNDSGDYGVAGVQSDPGNFTEFECFGGGLTNGVQLSFTIPCSTGNGGCDTSTPPLLDNIGVVSHTVGFNVIVQPDQVVVVESSTNLVNWTPLETNVMGSGPFYFSDPAVGNFHEKFYRARLY